MDHLPLDFIATIYYKTIEEGGRRTPAKTGYRPQVKIPFEKMTTSGSQSFLDTEWVNPGETVEAEIRMLSSQYFEGTLTEGQRFDLMEGPRVIAQGVIKQIVNDKLRRYYEINNYGTFS